MAAVDDQMHRSKPGNLGRLWKEFQAVQCAEIPLDTLIRKTESVVVHIQKYMNVAGRNFEHVL